MSLVGLDDPSVTEAYRHALAEPGGWLVLKYVSKDEIALLSRGSKGSSELRDTISEYTDPSPLYAFLHFRRRKILIKYIPDGTPKIMQIRTNVHFNTVSEKFQHDNTLPVTSVADLNDANLASELPLHTAKPDSRGSSSSTDSKSKLGGITEDADEGVNNNTTTDAPSEPSGPSIALDSAPSQVRPSMDYPKPPPTPPDPFDPALYLDSDRRMSSQTLRPSTSDLNFNPYLHLYKPKQKFGPRPMTDKRPNTAGAASARPISTLPPGLRMGSRSGNKDSRPKSRDSQHAPSALLSPTSINTESAIPPPPPVPESPHLSVLLTQRQPTSSAASVKSMPAISSKPKTPKATREQQRLKKAQELRKRQLEAERLRNERDEKLGLHRAAVDTQDSTEPSEYKEPVPETPVSAEAQTEELEQHPTPTNKNQTDLIEPDQQPVPQLSSQNTEVEPEAPLAPAPAPESEPEPEPESKLEPAPVPVPTPAPAEEEESSKDGTDSSKPDSAVEIGSPVSLQESTELASTRPSSISATSDTAQPKVPDISPITTSEADSDTTLRGLSALGIEQKSGERDTILAPSDEREQVESSAEDQSEPAIKAVKDFSTPEQAIVDPSEPVDTDLDLAPDEIPKSNHTRNDSSAANNKEKRHALVEPLNVELKRQSSEDSSETDEEFMEELRAAQVQRATPVSVSKSPITPFFPRRPSGATIGSALSSQEKSFPFLERSSPEESSPMNRSASTNFSLAARRNVSSGLSQRIKALAENSSRASSVIDMPVPTAGNANGDSPPSFVAQRKSSLQTTPPRPLTAIVTKPPRLSFVSVPSSRVASTEAPLSRATSSGGYSRGREESPQNGVQRNRESISVTARIIRDPRTQNPDLSMPTEGKPLELHKSPLTIDHQKSDRSLSPMRPPSIAPSTPATPLPSAGLPRSSSESSWRSFGRRMSEVRAPMNLSRNMSTTSIDTLATTDGTIGEKKRSKTGRFLRRMSSSISNTSRKTLAQMLNHHKETEPQVKEPLEPVRPVPQAQAVGDLNVQFPDTLLWKRRWVEVDAQGNLVFSASKTNDTSKSMMKKYHLSEFRLPLIPDLEREEMPYSVILDRHDGSTLQCACADSHSQMRALQVLLEAHRAC